MIRLSETTRVATVEGGWEIHLTPHTNTVVILDTLGQRSYRPLLTKCANDVLAIYRLDLSDTDHWWPSFNAIPPRKRRKALPHEVLQIATRLLRKQDELRQEHGSPLEFDDVDLVEEISFAPHPLLEALL